jgi:hypothetical protein
VPSIDPNVYAQRRIVVNPFCPLTKPTFTSYTVLEPPQPVLNRFVDTVAPSMTRVPKCTDTDKGAHTYNDGMIRLRCGLRTPRPAARTSLLWNRLSATPDCRSANIIGQDCLVKTELLVAFKQ